MSKVDVTPDNVRQRANAAADDWPDDRIAPALYIATLKARKAVNDSALSGGARDLWRAGVVALTWHILTSQSVGGNQVVKRLQDRNMTIEYDTKAATSGWLDEAHYFIPELAYVNERATLMTVPFGPDDTTEATEYDAG